VAVKYICILCKGIHIMELIIGLIVIAVVGYFVFFRKKEEVVVSEAPYKVETPVPAQDIAPQPVVVEGAGVVEIPQPAPVAETAPVKKTRKPRAPKAEVKPVAKKAAPKKVAAIKAKPKATKSKKA
jgi:hypothetical protein